MADTAARREARRRRILENSENRLQKITGKSKENPINDKSDDGTNSTKSNVINGSVFEEKISTEEVNQTKDFEYEDKISEFDKIKNFQLNEQAQEVNSTVTNCIVNATNEKRKDYDSLEFNSNSISFSNQHNVKELPEDIYLYNVFFSPMFSVIFAACLNFLVLINVNFFISMGIIMPYAILLATQLYVRKFQDTEASSMLIAALVLCNVKPQIVYTVKKLFTLFDTIAKNFALYITSFTLINWIIISIFYNSSHIQFL